MEVERMGYSNNVVLSAHFALNMYDNKQLLSVDDSAPPSTMSFGKLRTLRTTLCGK